MSKLRALLHASRLRTLPLSLASTITGSAIAYYLGVFNLTIFLMTALVVIALQVLSNFSNDLGDAEKGADNEHRIGPKRAVQSGAIQSDMMRKYIKIAMAIALISGISLILIARLFWWEKFILFAIGLACIYAAVAYTLGKFSYGYIGFGDLFVFIFFGIIGVVGSLYLCIHYISNSAFLPAFGCGMLSVGVLHLNNMRDRVNDEMNHKKTLAVRLGRENSKLYFLIIILLAIVTWASFVFTQNNVNAFSYLYWIGFLPVIWVLFRFFKVREDREYDRLLKPLALSSFFISILFFISQLI
jgi:1,4-dihydroxy-2-naphthoate octaprenyltransferase